MKSPSSSWVKNSFDAGADTVHLYFGEDRIVVADNGSGMTYNDLTQKWLFVAYSSKRTERPGDDFRNVAADRRHFAGSKGIGRFSSDRLGKQVVVQSRAKGKDRNVHQLTVDWDRFENNDREHFDAVPVAHAETVAFGCNLPSAPSDAGASRPPGCQDGDRRQGGAHRRKLISVSLLLNRQRLRDRHVQSTHIHAHPSRPAADRAVASTGQLR